LDVDSLRVVMKKDGEPIDVGSATKPSNSQWDIVLWLMKELSKRGKPMKAGWFVITGAMGSFMPATPGEYVATYGELGEISYKVK
jgi:2-keto-4-pentenoate hydratase